MSDPQNLNQSSPGALSTGGPPALQSSLSPAAPTPSTAQTSPPPTPSPNTGSPVNNGLGGSGQPATSQGAGGGLTPNPGTGIANGNGGQGVPLPPLPPDANVVFVPDTNAFLTLQAAGAGAVPQKTFCLIESIGVIQATNDGGATWKPYS